MKVQNLSNRVINNSNNGNGKTSLIQKPLSPGNSNALSSRISQKQSQAQEKAIGFVKRALTVERKFDNNIKKHKTRITKLEDEIKLNNEEIKKISEKQKELQESVGIGNNDRQQKDLMLIIKQRRGGKLSEEEEKHAKKLEENGLSAYQQRWLEFEDEKTIYRHFNAGLSDEIKEHNDSIESIMEEREKNNPMKDATEAAEEVLETAGKEVKGMFFQDIKDNIEKESSELKKKLIENQAEKQKERGNSSEKADKSKIVSKEHNDNFAEASSDTIHQIVSQEKVFGDIKHMLEEMILLDEDIKGAVVDTSY